MLREKQQRRREGAPQTTGASHASVLGQTRSVRPPGARDPLYKGLGPPQYAKGGRQDCSSREVHGSVRVEGVFGWWWGGHTWR